jgi:CheY-like chemotaxis protein
MSKILVIEKDKNHLEKTSLTLIFKGFTVFQAENCYEGFQQIEEEFPDLILCSLQVKEVSEINILQQIRNHPGTENIPFIFFVPDNLELDENLLLIEKLNAVEYIVKPIITEILINYINLLLKSRKSKNLNLQLLTI